MARNARALKFVSELKTNYCLDQYYYPKISMLTDLQGGIEGEVNNIIRQLESNGFDVSSSTIFCVMETKKKLLQRYYRKTGNTVYESYKKLVLDDLRPVGTLVPIEFLFVGGLISVILYMAAKFLGSFAEESGKIAAQKLFLDDKNIAKKLNIDIKEYQLIAKEVNIIIQENEMNDLLKNVTKAKKKTKVLSKSRVKGKN